MDIKTDYLQNYESIFILLLLIFTFLCARFI